MKNLFLLSKTSTLFEVVWGPDRGSYRGGGGLRVRQIGRELHTASYDPEQKRAKMGALGPPLFPPYVGFWRVSIQLKGHGFFIHSSFKDRSDIGYLE